MNKSKFKYGDLIVLKPNANVELSEGGTLSKRIVNEPELWAVDYYDPETGMLNINRVLRPYPGAYCSWVHESEVERVVSRRTIAKR